MQMRKHTYTHIQIHSKHIMNLDLPYFGAGGLGTYGDGSSSVGAHDVGTYGAGAPNAGASGVGARDIGALDASVHVVGAHNFDAHGKTQYKWRHTVILSLA